MFRKKSNIQSFDLKKEKKLPRYPVHHAGGKVEHEPVVADGRNNAHEVQDE